MKNRQIPPSKQRGVTLVEVMVAMLVTASGLLGFAALQTRALGATEDAYLRMQAMTMAQGVMERLRVSGVTGPGQQSNAINAAAYATYTTASSWSGTLAATPPDPYCFRASGPACNIVAADIYQVRKQAASALPSGEVLINNTTAGCSFGQACVFVAWGGETAANCASQYSSSQSVPRQCVVVQGM